jgi:hypothetical protein
MHWREPILVIIAVLIGAYLVTKFPAINVLGRVLP